MERSRGLTTEWAVRTVIAGAALVILGHLLLRPGFLLHYDSVSVPRQDLLPWMWGAGTSAPRSVPQDAVIALLDNLIPGWVLQRILVVSALLLLGLGVAGLLRGAAALARACAAVVAMWSTFVYERMAIGHWGFLLGLAVLPWVLAAATDVRLGVPRAPARLVAWVAVGSLVPSAGALQMATVGVVLAWPGPRAWRPTLLAAIGVVAIQLVWLLPGILTPGSSPAEAAERFGLRSEGPAGPLLTALGTGGIWNSSLMPTSRDTALGALAPLVLLALALLGGARLRALGRTWIGPLVLVSVTGIAWAVSTAVPPFAGCVAAIESLPGGGLLRDAHKWLAPWLVLLSMCAGLGLARLVERVPGRDARVAAIVAAVILPFVLLPDLAFGMWGRLQPVSYPDDWQQVRSALKGSDAPGDVVSWPWSAFRAYEWNEQRTVLDPATRYLPRTVVTDSRLLVEGDDGPIIVPSDDPRSQAVGEALLGSDPAERLRALGIGWILVQDGQPPAPGFPRELPESLSRSSLVEVDTPTLDLRRLVGSVEMADRAPTWALRIAWLVWASALLASVAGLARQRVGSASLGRGNGRRDSASLRETDRS